ncbi:hypothetical protein DASC09_021860 [Saccharomycopsis crataegensis]|uniref:Uncharacterized protein n=1 Tax=Saccharomycopsis crataegensis TaxID=43959 RepID=A0AAV5QJR3_9ASCO|nr:hypothetical protein DASC09_021860 [Saccharomycopsis crataegensis]
MLQCFNSFHSTNNIQLNIHGNFLKYLSFLIIISCDIDSVTSHNYRDRRQFSNGGNEVFRGTLTTMQDEDK